jgi:hypothetical protein
LKVQIPYLSHWRGSTGKFNITIEVGRNADKSEEMRAKIKASTPQQSVRTATYGYIETERALARVFDLEDVLRDKTFRARLLHLRKCGLTPINPGRGVRIRYTFSDVCQLLVGLVLAEINIDPLLIVRTLQRHWKQRSGFHAAINQILRVESEKKEKPLIGAKDCIVVLRPRFMSAALGERGLMIKPDGISLRSPPPPVEIEFVWPPNATLEIDLQESSEQICAFNLSKRIRDLEQALAAVSATNE